jgi:hypothetical protein
LKLVTLAGMLSIWKVVVASLVLRRVVHRCIGWCVYLYKKKSGCGGRNKEGLP